MHDFHDLPKIRDSLSYLYLEHCKIDQEAKAIAFHDKTGKVPVPIASLSLLMLGPGTSITHAAIVALADNGCMVIWCGEEGVRTYASSIGETHSSARIIRQAELCSDEAKRLQVVMRMYKKRFDEILPQDCTIQEIRGKEGLRIRNAYQDASKKYKVIWTGRNYDRSQWGNSDPVNRALSAANSCLYGICHASIVSLGYSPALGFIHTGKQLSFVYDIADLYKTEISIPVSFMAAAENEHGIEKTVRMRCRDIFKRNRILKRIVLDIEDCLNVEQAEVIPISTLDYNLDPCCPAPLWDPEEENKEVNGSIHS